MFKKFIFLLLLLVQPWAWAELNAADNVLLPKNSSLKFLGQKVENRGMAYYEDPYFFEGQAKIRGLLYARWFPIGLNGNGGHSHRLELHFFPEKSELVHLPLLIKDEYQKENERDINLTNSSEESKKLVAKYFDNIPENFFKYEEGELKQPFIATIEEYGSFIDYDARFYEAKLVSLKKIAKNKGKGALIEQNIWYSEYGPPRIGIYMVKSEDGYANLRAAPSTNAKVLMKSSNGDHYHKIKTVNDWLYVESYNENEPIKGYIHKSQVVARYYSN